MTAILCNKIVTLTALKHILLFKVNAHFDSEKLLDFKQQVGAELLVGIVTNKDEMNDDSVEVADKIMWCEPDDVDILVATSNHVTANENFSCRIKTIFICFENANTAKFIYYRTTNDNFNGYLGILYCLDLALSYILKIYSNLLWISSTSDNFESFNDQEKISKAMETFIGNKQYFLWYFIYS